MMNRHIVLIVMMINLLVIVTSLEKVDLPSLPYDYKALEPHIDEKTMKVHHTGHHQAYTNNLNAAIEALKQSSDIDKNLVKNSKTVEELLMQLDKITDDQLRLQVRNNGGGYVNHCMFWQLLISREDYVKPTPNLVQIIEQHFGSFEMFTLMFSDAATKLFGSGWVWLVEDRGGVLTIRSYANQDTPFSNYDGSYPILGIDVWEHAYYLKHQNKRAEYVKDFWQVVNWRRVEENLLNVRKNSHDEL